MCRFGHYQSRRACDPIPFLAISSRDILHATHASNSRSSLEIDLGTYLSHLVARSPGTKGLRNAGHELSEYPDAPCDHRGCESLLSLAAIQTSWPQILHIVPETSGELAEIFFARGSTDPPLRLPLEFTISSHTSRRLPKPTDSRAAHAGASVEGAVTYQLVGRQLFQREKAHFVAEVCLQGGAYLYDDMDNSGVLIKTGEALDLLTPTEEATYVVYHRTSEARVSFELFIYYWH